MSMIMKNILKRIIFVIMLLSLLNFSMPVLLKGGNDIILKTNSSASKIYNQMDSGIVWNVTLNMTETGGLNDWVAFGEAPDANDGPPVDSYDQPKPPAPMLPYVRAWLNDSLPIPHHQLFKDYREYNNSNYKEWNLSVHWNPTDGSNTDINVTWNPDEFNNCEYDSVILYDIENNNEVEMFENSYYEFNCPAYVPQVFTINCTIILNQHPIVNNIYPLNGSTNIERPPSELNITVEDPDADTMDLYIHWKNHVKEWVTLENYSNVGNGTYNFIPSGNDWIWGNTLYNWSVNITDGTNWTNETYNYTTGGSRYDVNNDNKVNFQDAGLVWIHRTSEVPYDGLYDVNKDGQVNFQDAGLTWVNRD